MPKKEDLETIVAELRSLDSKVALLNQKLATSDKNAEVIARTLVAMNNRLKKLEEGGQARAQNGGANASNEELERKFATKRELQELKYVLDSINPLEYATISQVRELVNERLGDVKKTAASLVKEKKKDETGMFERM